MNSFNLKIITSSGVHYDGECTSLVVPTTDGYYGIQANHSPIIIGITKGDIKYSINDKTDNVFTEGSVLKFSNNSAVILARK